MKTSTIYRLSTFIILLILSSGLFAQTGPGGVGNSDGNSGNPRNILWLDASSLSYTNDDNLSTWTDESGNSNDFSQPNDSYTPIFKTVGQNGLPYAEFSKMDNRIVLNPFNDMPTTGITSFIVFKSSDTDNGLFSYNTTSSDNAFLLFNNGSLATYIDGSNTNSGTNINNGGNWQFFSHKWQSSGGNLIFNQNGDELENSTFANGDNIPTGGSFAIGGEQDSPDGGYDAGQAFQGDIAEVIMYSSYLNKAQRLLVENYLSEKYALAFTTAGNDKFGNDAAFDAAFVQNIAGIGKADDGTDHTFSGSDGLYLQERNSSLANTEFVMLAHDGTTNSSATIYTGGDLPGTTEAAWAKTWYIEKTTTDGIDTKIIFDFKEALTDGEYPATPADYVLLYRSGTTGAFSEVTTAGVGILDADQLYFDLDDANLQNGYYTIGTTDQTNSPAEGVAGRTWYALASGDWDNSNFWTLDPSGALPNNPDNEVPSNNDKVVIHTGKTISLTSDTKTVSGITIEGILQLGTTSGHNFNIIRGNGRIRLASDNFPEGDKTHFVTAGQGGGTVVWQGGTYTLNNPLTTYEFYNMEIDLDNAANSVTLLKDLALNGQFQVNQGEFYINDATQTTDLVLSVAEDVLIESNGKILTGAGNARHQFDFYGNLTNNGVLKFTNRTSATYNSEATNGIVDANFLHASRNQNIQCNGTSDFYRIEIDKGTDDTYELAIEADDASHFNLFGYANRSHDEVAQLDDNAAAANQRNPNALGLYRGTVRLKSNVNVPVLNNVVNYNISEAARLWIDGGSAAKSDGTAIVVYGKIQVTNGTLNSTVNSGITIRENGLIKVEGGTLNTNVIRTSVFGASNVGGYVQSGGTVNIVNPNSATNDYYHFSMTYPGNVFNMSGGTLHIYDAGGTATGEGGIFIASDPENINVTGGTVIAEIASTTNPFKITSTAPFYNLILRNTYDAVTDHILDAGTNINGDATADLAAQPLVVLNNLTIEANAFLNHDGNDVYISRDFYIDRNAQTVTFDNTGMNDSYNDYNVGYLFDPAIPNNTIFNGSEDGEFYIGYNSSDGFEQYFTDFTVDKTAGSKITIVCDNEKTAQYQDDNNRNHWYARLPRIENELKVENGILDQGQSAIRLFGPLTVLEDGECGVWEEGTTHPWAWFMIKDADLEINTESGAVIGNIKMNPNPQTDIITFTSDVYIKRIGYFHGRFNLQSYELKLDYLIDGLTTNNYDIDDGRDSDEMFYSSGNASDGGLLLYVPAGTTDGTTFPYPLGVLGKYTPAEIELSNVTDDGYIRITPVDGELQTTELTGGDLLNYYWKVDYQDFNSNPTVNRLRFDYNNADIVGTEANYVAGKVLDEYPFDRIYEDETIPESEGVDAANNRITFNGQTDAGFTLEKANYTAGVTGRFTGSPEIFYVRANGDWNDVDTWSYSRGGGSAGDYPKAGDIAIMRRTSVTYSGIVTVRQAEQAAAVIFDDENGWSSGCPRIVFDTQNNYASYGSDFDVVDVADTHEGGTLDYNTHGAVIQYNIEDDYSGASNSLEFDGTDDYVAIQNYNYNTDGLTEFTVEAWIKTNDAGDQIIASFDRNQYWRLEVNGNGGGNGQIGFDVMTDAGQLDFGSSSRIDDGNWHHVAGVFDNGSVSIYIDGALDNSTTSGTTFGSAGVTRYGFVGVGSEADTYDGTTGPNDYFNGNISEFRVWNVARSQAQIQAAMDAALTGSETGLDIYYKLDGSGSDNTATDITSNGNTGDLNNFSLPGAWTSSHPWGSGFPGGDFGDFNKYPNALVIYAWDGATANADVTLSSQATEYPQMWFAGGNNSRIFRFPNNDITVHGGFTVPHTAIVAANGASDNTITMEQNVNIGSSSLNYGTFLFPGNDAGLVTLDIKKNLNIRGGANSLVGIENAAGGTTVHKLKVAGDITIESSGGDIKLGDGDPVKSNVELELTGTGEHSFVNNAGALPQFYRIIMNKGTDATSTFAFNNNFSLTGSTSGAGIDKAIALQNGKLILNDAAINVDMTTGDDDFYIPASAGLEVRQGTANANGNSGILLDGKLHVSGGTVDMTGGDNYIQYSATGNAEIEVSGGTLTVGSQIRRGLTSSEGILTYTQSGGTVIVGNDAAPENNRGVFEILNTGSSFTHTGGSFQIARSQSGSPTIASFYFDPETVSLDPSSNFTIGSASTPTGQTITIYPGQPINNLTVNDDSGNSPTAQLSVVDANINNNLTIEGNTEFDANGLTVEIKGDLTNNGSYNANGNTTIFSGTADQTIDGTTTFYNLHQTSSTDLQVNSNITVANNFHIEATFTDNDNTVTVLNAIHNEGTHISGTTGGIKLQGTTDEQIMTGDGTYGILTINNAFGIKVPTGNAPFIEKQLRLSSGVFNIGGNLLTLSKDCQIIEENPFSATNMIQTNISFTDNGIKKYFPPYVGPGEESFTFPVGSGGTYTPVDVYVTQNSSENGELIVKPAAELHPSIINDTEAPDPELNDLTNVLQYHWTLISNNITDGSGRAEMFYDASDLELTSPDYNVTDYITAKLLRDADGAWNKYDNASFDETNQKLIFYFNNATDAELTGDYTAGVDGNTFNGAIPDNVPLYVSNGTGGGDWDATGTWLIDDSGTLVTPSSLGLPNVPRGARIKVQNGDVVTNTNNFISAYSLNLIGTLKMNSTYGNRLGNVEGTGTLYSERGTLPAGYYNNFFASTGGTVEYGGTSDISTLSNISEVNNLKFSGTGKRELPNLDLTILGNLIIDGDDNTLELINEFDNRTDLRGDLVFNAGSFDAGFGDNAIVVMNGSSAQTINGTNTFTGSSSFNHFEIKNSAGVTINTAVEISHNLSLTQGVINTDATNTFTLTNTDTDVVTGGSTGSFIDGPLYKNVSDGSEFTFPVGNT